jgi:hypothetical protein
VLPARFDVFKCTTRKLFRMERWFGLDLCFGHLPRIRGLLHGLGVHRPTAECVREQLSRCVAGARQYMRLSVMPESGVLPARFDVFKCTTRKLFRVERWLGLDLCFRRLPRIRGLLHQRGMH